MSSTERQETMMETFKALYGMSETSNPVQILGPIFYLPESDTCVIHAPGGFYDRDSAWELTHLVRELNAHKHDEIASLAFATFLEGQMQVLKYIDHTGTMVVVFRVGKVSGGWHLAHDKYQDYQLKLQTLLNVVDFHRKNHRGN